MSRGQLAILGMLGMALLAAGLGLWWRHVHTRQALEFWGPAAAQLIAQADKVEAMLVEPLAGQSGESIGRYQEFLQVDFEQYGIVAMKNVTNAPGFLNARHALTLGKSFDWRVDPSACQPTWRYALRYSSQADQVTILLSFPCKMIRLSDSDRTAGIGPIAKGLETVLNEQLSVSPASGSDSARKE